MSGIAHKLQTNGLKRQKKHLYLVLNCTFKCLGPTGGKEETKTENIPGFNNLDKNDRKNILFNHLAEQNADLMEEVINMKKAMKKMFTQMINDFEEGMDSLKDVTKKNNIETKKALMNMEKKID